MIPKGMPDGGGTVAEKRLALDSKVVIGAGCNEDDDALEPEKVFALGTLP